MAKYLNVDEIIPDEQIITVGGRRFDLSHTPARATARLIQVNSWANTKKIADDPSKKYDAYEKEITALLEVLGKDEDGEYATFDWVMDNVSMGQFNAIMQFITECMNTSTVADGETKGNFTKEKKDKAK